MKKDKSHIFMEKGRKELSHHTRTHTIRATHQDYMCVIFTLFWGHCVICFAFFKQAKLCDNDHQTI